MQWYWYLLIVLFVLVAGIALVVPRLRRRPGPPTAPTGARPTPAAPPAPAPEPTAAPTVTPTAPPVEEAPAPVEAPVVVETPAPTAGRLVRLRARLSRSQNVFGRGLLAVLSRDRLDDEAWEEI